ncbi:MAG: transglutaminase-like domain-containing protein [Lachnospiraceae bacterium]|nr:transglutaminase-like domain-containing protein [Lachnospiraceae bacterium]
MLDDLLFYGLEKKENDLHDKSDDLLHCALVGLLIFCASYGCVLGILSQFELKVNYTLIMIILFITAMFLALIHISRVFYIIGYFSFMFLFSYALFSLRTYANSGYQALLNVVNEAYSNHYMLSSIREYTEIIDDRYISVTCVSIFLGLFLVLLLNVDIFNNMYYATAFFLTFLPLQIGIFIGRYPSYFSLVLLFFSYFGIFLLRHSCHFYFAQPPKRNRPREYTFEYYDKMKRFTVFHKSNARSMLSLCIFALVLSLMFSAFTSSVVRTSEAEAILNKSSLKASLDENVKILTQTGIMGLFNRYEAKGGISGGKLGGVRSVSPDYEPDLLVSFVPYSFETLYLKGYTSWYYTGNSWEAPVPEKGYALNMPSSTGLSSRSSIAGERILSESHALSLMSDAGIIDDSSARMKVENLDADTGYLYIPYCISSIPQATITEPGSYLNGFSERDDERVYDFAPYSLTVQKEIFDAGQDLLKLYSEEELNALRDYEEEVYQNYLQIPPSILNDLMSYHDRIGTAGNVKDQIVLIYDFFLRNYTYDMAPGATPYNRDFVTYFLDEQKRGYCAHFASAGAMLLRSYGIPARYVEGYVVTTTGITESGELRGQDASYYFTGTNPLGPQPLISTEVTDGDAHAWVEVYISGFGWMPVEFTVPDSGQSGASYVDFLTSLSNLLRPGYIKGGDTEDGSDTSDPIDPAAFLNLTGPSAFNVFTAIIILLMVIPLLKRTFVTLKDLSLRRRKYRAGDYAPLVSRYYMRSCRRLSGKKKVSSPMFTADTFALISRLIACGSKKGRKLAGILEREGLTLDDINLLTRTCFYSEKNISRSQADLLIKFYRSI